MTDQEFINNVKAAKMRTLASAVELLNSAVRRTSVDGEPAFESFEIIEMLEVSDRIEKIIKEGLNNELPD